MDNAVNARQPLLGAQPPAALSLEWQHRGDAGALWRALGTLPLRHAVIGIGAPLVQAVTAEVPGLAPFSRLERGRHAMPATQRDLWALVPGADAGQVFERAEALQTALAPYAAIVEATPMFNYRHGRDLSGYQDGTENPKGDAAWAAALVPEGEGCGGSFALVQRYLHFRDRLAALAQPQRDRVIGRTLDGDQEIAEAPESTHVKRTAQEDFEPPAFLLRRSMPWGDLRRHGLLFIAYACELSTLQRQLERMMGLEDGLQDALLAHTQAETGGYYWCPPAAGGRLVLPAVPAAVAAVPPVAEAPTLAAPRVRLIDRGPLELQGSFEIAGVPVRQARLCRCGRSQRKPYCDASHAENGFDGDGTVPPIDEPQATVVPACIRVQPVADGPLVLHGAVEITSANGRTVTCCTSATLCRCGQSRRKPFCDGSHAAAGFRAPD